MVTVVPQRAAAIVLAVLGLAFASCDGEPDAASPPDEPIAELAQHDGSFCPRSLPRASQESYGFGTSERAEEAPSLWEPEEAWVCEYVTKNIAPRDANGAWYEWVRQGEPRRLSGEALHSFAAALRDLRPSEADVCTSDLGPRYLVSYVYESDLTGVVIDDYGCQEIRLTDEPFETVPGDAAQPGTVAGVLMGPADLLRDLKVK